MKVGLALSLIVFIFAANLASAAVSAVPSQITVGESPREISFFATNTTGIRQQFEAEFSFPTKFTIIKKPQWIESGARENIVLNIFPQHGFENTTYVGTIKVTIGGDVAEKNVILNYLNQNECSVQSKTTIANSGDVTILLKNNSYRPKSVTLVEIRNVPADWKITGNTQFSIGPFEQKTFGTKLEMNSALNGNAVFVYKCANTEFTESVKVEHKDGGIPASMFAVFGQASTMANGEFMLDLFLVIIAAILLIAFIARLVRIVNRDLEQNTGANK